MPSKNPAARVFSTTSDLWRVMSLPCWHYAIMTGRFALACILLMNVRLSHHVAQSCGVLQWCQHHHSLMYEYTAMLQSFKGICKDWFVAAVLRNTVCHCGLLSSHDALNEHNRHQQAAFRFHGTKCEDCSLYCHYYWMA